MSVAQAIDLLYYYKITDSSFGLYEPPHRAEERAFCLKNYEFKYGSGTVSLPIDEKLVTAELGRAPAQPIADIRAALFAALAAPIGQAPLEQFLCPGDAVTLIVSDMSRFWMRQDLVVPALLAYLNTVCGIPDDKIVILIATGTHEGGPEAELRQLVTDAVFDRVPVKNHDCMAEDLVTLGVTSRGTPVRVNPLVVGRKVVALGGVTHHVMAGFGGGRKSILPGVASLETIRANHALALDATAPRSNPAIGNGVLAGNPLHEDMCEAAAMVDKLFAISLVMNTEMRLAKIFAGHWHDSWLAACRATDETYEVPIDEKADVVIAGAGGFPKDMSLYQGTKTIDNIESGLKAGGTLLLIMECREGGGPAEYFDWVKSLTAGTLDADLRAAFTIPGYIFYLNCEQAARYHIRMLTRIPPETLAPMGIEAVSDPAALLDGIELAGKTVYLIKSGATVIPKPIKKGDLT